MELLTILYAMLAAITGIGGGERSVLADRGAVAASTSAECAPRLGGVQAMQRALAVKRAPVALRIVTVRPEGRAFPLRPAPAMVRLAGFANRRQ